MVVADLSTSPTLSAYSASSYDMISNHPRSTALSSSLTTDGYDDDDEIVYDVSEPENSFSDDDFVVLNRPPQARPDINDEAQTPVRSTLQLADRFGNLEISPKASNTLAKPQPAKVAVAQRAVSGGEESVKQKQKQKGRKKKKNTTPAELYPSPEPSPVQASSTLQAVAASRPEVQKKGSVKSKSKKKKQRKTASPPPAGLGSRPIVDDISDRLSLNGDGEIPPSIYEEAAVYISSYVFSFFSELPHNCFLSTAIYPTPRLRTTRFVVLLSFSLLSSNSGLLMQLYHALLRQQKCSSRHTPS